MRVLQSKFLVGGVLSFVILSAGCFGDSRMAAYNSWKQGLLPYDPEIIEYGLRRDPEASKLVVGKSLDEVRTRFQDVHETEGSFDILVSKSLGPRTAKRKYYQWAQRYVIFQVEDNRVVALDFVHG